MAPEIFDRKARRLKASRSVASKAEDRWMLAHLAQESMARLNATQTVVASALVLGPAAAELRTLLIERGAERVVAQAYATGGAGRLVAIFDEDRPPFADASFDLVMSVGGLDTVNDLPGALIRIRQILRPGGQFIGAMAGAGSLPVLRSAAAPIVPGPRFHPQIDVRAAGDLLARAGFAVPVADLDVVQARFEGVHGLLRDLRSNALSNVLPDLLPMTRAQWRAIEENFQRAASAGKTTETFAFVHMSGRASSRR